MLIRYISLFHLKNPAAIADDFWSFYINSWIFLFSILSEIFNHLATEEKRLSILFHVCIGQNPSEQAG